MQSQSQKESQASGSFDPVWEEIFRAQEWGKYPPEHVIRFVARNFYKAPDRKAVKILDLGSGPGANAWYVAREGFACSAIDGSATAIERLKARLAVDRLEVDARVGDFIQLPWKDQTFDAVVETGALCCNRFAMVKRVVSEVKRVLKPGGLFCSANFTDSSWGYGVGRQVEPGGFADITEGPLVGKGFILFMGRAQVDELFSDFRDVSVERLGYTVENQKQLIDLWIVTARKA
ncbi:MAG TPA: class I SAM-dependent methyltransferase [Polyangia bacterium]|jgi:SAM-dependent methyltransferase|nr:class I SAM-dependent methyltransferase [Polyangia bacterium]